MGIFPEDMIPPELSAEAKAIDLLAGTELGALISEKAAAARAETAAAERKRREGALAQAVDLVFADQLNAERARHWPDEITLECYKADARTFCDWARSRGVDCLPAQATTVAAFLFDRAIVDDARPADLRQTVKAVAFAHDLGQHYLDSRPIAAALAFIEAMHAEASSTLLSTATSNGDETEKDA